MQAHTEDDTEGSAGTVEVVASGGGAEQRRGPAAAGVAEPRHGHHPQVAL